jgi:hypothetical protein
MLKVVGLDLKSAVLHKKAIYASENTYGVFVDLLEALKSNEFDNITRIDVSEIDNIVVSYDGRIKMKIGTMSNLDEKLKKARYIVMEKESKKAKGTLDLTVDNTAYFKEKK